jgi:hypothetical protein
MTGRNMQGEPVIEAMRLYVVHGGPKPKRDRRHGGNRRVSVGTTSYPGHVSDDKRTTPDWGYPGDMKRLVLLAAILAGCGSDPVDVEGRWTVSVTNRADDCNIGWTEGQSSSGVTVDITQNSDAIIVDVTGIGGGVLDLFLGGDDVFSGDVDGDHIQATRQGTRSNNQGNCTYTYNATFAADVNGDTMEGSIKYVPAHNGNSDCAAIVCENVQDFSGNRPPN